MHRKESKLTLLLFKLYAMSKRKESNNESRASIIAPLIKILLTLAGFGCLIFAAFVVSMIAGLVVAGISCFLLAWLYGSPEPAATTVQ